MVVTETMELTIPDHFTTGILSGDDLTFFYYDIGLDNLEGWPTVYDWDAIVTEFSGRLNIEVCGSANTIDNPLPNTIIFNVSKYKDKGIVAAAFFRHLRNAFAHYHIVREGENYYITDNDGKGMCGLVNADLLKEFCFRLFDRREKILNDIKDSQNPTI